MSYFNLYSSYISKEISSSLNYFSVTLAEYFSTFGEIEAVRVSFVVLCVFVCLLVF